MLKLSTYKTFTIEEDIIHHLMFQTFFHKRNGLFYGKLGIAIVFFELGRYRNNLVYTDYAEDLKNLLPNKINDKMTLDFATGLSGYGWGVEYMVQQQFIDNDNTEICTDIDRNIMLMNIQRLSDLSLEKGLEGFLHYILIRIVGAKIKKIPIPFDKQYLKDTYIRLQSIPDEEISNGLCYLKQAFVSYLDTGLLNYRPDISLFINAIELNNEEDIFSAKLGLSNGLAGNLLKIVNR